jgi:3-hydroxyisobutyrate dehydrogenase-like beta-hydroxyacid dehydrogenase
MTKVGIVGIGIMGSAIARNLLAAGMAVVGFDTAAERRDALATMGGVAVDSAAAVAGDADVVLASLPSAAALDETVAAILAKPPRRRIVLAELSTLPIEVKLTGRDALAAAGIAMLDCPLSGTGAQAVTRDLVVYASGEGSDYERCVPVFAGFARASHYLGAFGNGSKMKFVANLLVAIHNVASAEAMVLGIKAGLDPDDIVKVIAGGAGTSRIFELRAPMMASARYQPPGMRMDLWQKDMAVIGEFARSLGVATPLFAASAPVYDAAIGLGLAGQDTAAVCAVLERMAGVERKAPNRSAVAGGEKP